MFRGWGWEREGRKGAKGAEKNLLNEKQGGQAFHAHAECRSTHGLMDRHFFNAKAQRRKGRQVYKKLKSEYRSLIAVGDQSPDKKSLSLCALCAFALNSQK